MDDFGGSGWPLGPMSSSRGTMRGSGGSDEMLEAEDMLEMEEWEWELGEASDETLPWWLTAVAAGWCAGLNGYDLLISGADWCRVAASKWWAGPPSGWWDEPS